MPSIKGGDMNAFTGFTLEHFNELFADSRLMLILSETFLFGLLVSLDCDGDRNLWSHLYLSIEEEVRRTFALHQQHSHGSARRYDRGQLLDSLYDDEVPARFPICSG